MNAIKRCTRCILPSSLKSISFDEEGVCSYCRKYEEDFKDWDAIQDRKQNEFRQILERAKKLRRPYDVLVPLSGGKDSTYTLYLCTRVYGMKTLAITLDNGFLTEIAKQNIRNAIQSSNADHIFYTINRENASELFTVFTKKTGDFCNACMRAINFSIEFATKAFHVPLVIKGSGRRVQYVSQIKEVSSLNTPSYFENVIKGTGAMPKFKYLSKNKRKLEIQKVIGGISDIFGIRRTTLMRFIPQHIGLYDYVYRPYSEIIEILKNEMKWSDGEGSFEHLDCFLHDAPFFKDTLRIPGISKNTFHRSGLIRQGLLTRAEALQAEERELNEIRPPEELLDFLKENGIEFEEYKNAVVNANKSQYEPKLQRIARNIYHKFRKF